MVWVSAVGNLRVTMCVFSTHIQCKRPRSVIVAHEYKKYALTGVMPKTQV